MSEQPDTEIKVARRKPVNFGKRFSLRFSEEELDILAEFQAELQKLAPAGKTVSLSMAVRAAIQRLKTTNPNEVKK